MGRGCSRFRTVTKSVILSEAKNLKTPASTTAMQIVEVKAIRSFTAFRMTPLNTIAPKRYQK